MILVEIAVALFSNSFAETSISVLSRPQSAGE
jgi:hypothetical protein